MFKATRSIIWNQPMAYMGGWVNKVVYKHTVEYYSASKKERNPLFTTAGMSLQ